MTSTSKGIDPLLPPGRRNFSLQPNRASTHTFSQPPRSWLRQTSEPGSNIDALSKVKPLDVFEPPLKKLKLGDHPASSEGGILEGGKPKSPVTDHAATSDPTFSTKRQEEHPRIRKLSLFPLRPGSSQPRASTGCHRPLAIERAARKDAVAVKAYAPEPPPCAPRYHEKEPADFFPWTGYHSEDVLNELTTRQGFYDKIQASQSESSTARPSVWSSLKHKSGLQILSSLFVSALDQRQAYGTITANSTFKPPPRVTLTDTKREAWLRDLANPLIPLRRLSRTIPHGIRGRTLLDHCLGKDIPTTRAVWLVKCVGANEIRAFKRKGTGGVFTVGGEVKWIKDWTTNIEQFLESIIASCAGSDWKSKVNYGLRLASHLYSERLLDRDHYLNWLINSLECSDLESVPTWLLVQQIHQQELLQQRRRGRRLASAVLEHILKVSNRYERTDHLKKTVESSNSRQANASANRRVCDPVLCQLIETIRLIMASAPTCFLLPNSWNKYGEILKTCFVSQENHDMQICFENLLRRNLDLQANVPRHHRQSEQAETSLRQRIIFLLDTLYIQPDYSGIAATCLRTTNDSDVLIRTCVEWSSSNYRHGLWRAYGAARLMRIWSRHGIELQQPLLDFLATASGHLGFVQEGIYRLYALLVSSKHFSVGRYLQWLMARGTLHCRSGRAQDCPYDIGLLFELPLNGLPSHVLNLRQMLLSSLIKTFAEEESHLITITKSQIAAQIPDVFPSSQYQNSLLQQAEDSMRLSQTVKSDVARWIRHAVLIRLPVDDTDTDSEHGQLMKPGSSAYSIISFDSFLKIRRILEDIGDFNILADILNLLANQVFGITLTAVADTVNTYFDVFTAIGAADDLFQKLCKNVELNSNQELESTFLESLLDLGCRLPEADKEMQRLRKAVRAQATKFPPAACSPISDTMVEAVQSNEPTFASEMDQIFASGTSMDIQTLTRVFRTLIDHLEKSFNDSGHLVVRFSSLLATLRGFHLNAFDALFGEWLHEWLRSNGSRYRVMSLVPLICFKVVSLGLVLQAIEQVTETRSDESQDFDMGLSLLELATGDRPESTYPGDYRGYRLRDQLRETIQTAPTIVIATMHRAIKACQTSNSSTCTRAERKNSRESVRELAYLILLWHSENTAGAAFVTFQCSLSPDMQRTIGIILHQVELGDSSCSSDCKHIMETLNDISDFNISLYKLKLRAAFRSVMSFSQDFTTSLSRAIIERATNSSEDHGNLWTSLVSDLPTSQASSLENLAEGEVLAWAMDDTISTSDAKARQISSLISIVEASISCTPVAEASTPIERIVDILTKILHSFQPNDRCCRLRTDYDCVLRRIDALLRLLVVHQVAMQDPRYPQNNLHQLLIALSLLLIDPILASNPSLSHRMFDLLSLLTDFLSDDTRLRCIRSLRDDHRTQDPRLRFIFGYSNCVESEWLQFVSRSSSAAEARPGGAAVTASKAYHIRRWEMMQDATPLTTENDTSLSLTLFGSRKSVL